MKITFVQGYAEYAAMLRAAEAGEGNSEPRDVFVAPPGLNDSGKFAVVDNSQGKARAEDFDTLDGALMFALGIHEADAKGVWGRMGSVADRGNFV